MEEERDCDASRCIGNRKADSWYRAEGDLSACDSFVTD